MAALHFAIQWIGIGVEYLVAIALIVGGLYISVLFTINSANPLAWLLKPLKIAGYVMALVGLSIGLIAYGKTIGAADCQKRWQAANLQAQLDAAQRDIDIQKTAAELAKKQSDDLANQNDELQRKVADYENATRNAPDCRRANPDDIGRLCAIIGHGAPGCPRSK